jgi:hypothetical protein
VSFARLTCIGFEDLAVAHYRELPSIKQPLISNSHRRCKWQLT